MRECVMDCIEYTQIEIYNLAAQSHVGKSFKNATNTFQTNTETILFILETVKHLGIQHKCKIFQASSSEMLGEPSSLYGVSKLSAHLIVKYFRETYGMFVCSGILYNHESPRRKDTFVTQKIIQGLKSGECFTLGNIDARRDWGHAKDYVEAMWLMLQQDVPEDFVICTGETHSVREFCEVAFGHAGLNWEDHVVIDEAFFRPAEVDLLVGAAAKAEELLDWKPGTSFENLVTMMVDADIDLLTGKLKGIS